MGDPSKTFKILEAKYVKLFVLQNLFFGPTHLFVSLMPKLIYVSPWLENASVFKESDCMMRDRSKPLV